MRMRLLALLLVAAMTTFVVIAAGCGGSDETTTTAAPASTETTAAGGGGEIDGAEVFATNCSGCHGSEGKGANGPDLTPLTDADVDKVKNQVTNGGSVMPALGDQLTPEQIDAVAIYAVGLE